MPSYLRISPRGNRCGLATARCDERTLTLLVLPKCWRPRMAKITSKPPYFLRHKLRQEPSQVIAAYEGDYLRYEPGDAALVDALLEYAQQEFGDHESQGSTEEDRRSPLLCPCSAPSMSLVQDAEDLVAPQATTSTEAILALALLLRRLDQTGRRERFAPTASDTSASTFTTGESERDSPVLSLLRAWEFVNLVEANILQLRRGYVSEADWLGNARGRIAAGSIVRHLATGLPSLHCHYDTFTDATPFFRAIVTAVEQVAFSIPSLGLLSDTQLALSSGDRAMVLRRRLAHIAALDIPSAVNAVREATLGRLLRVWEPVHALCEPILLARPPGPGKGTGTSSSMVWILNTAGLWEDWLFHGFSRITSSGVVVERGNRKGRAGRWNCGTPWSGKAALRGGIPRDKQPDFFAVVNDPREYWVIDAKYKLDAAVEAGDQYQLFAYTHLASHRGVGGLDSPITHAAVVKPRSDSDNDETERPTRFIRGEGGRSAVGSDLYLEQWFLPFPRISDVESDAAWESGEERLAHALGTVILGAELALISSAIRG